MAALTVLKQLLISELFGWLHYSVSIRFVAHDVDGAVSRFLLLAVENVIDGFLRLSRCADYQLRIALEPSNP